MPAVTLWNIAKVWGQQCDPVTRPGVSLYTVNGWIDGKTGFSYGPGTWCVTYDGAAPNILPPAPPPENLAPTSSVVDRTCVRCSTKASTVNPSSPITGAPAPAPTPGARPASHMALPWWLWVLVALTLAQVIHGRNP